MKKKKFLFLIFAGIILAGGIQVNSAMAADNGCGTANRTYPAEAISFGNDTACASGYTEVLGDFSTSGFEFPNVGYSASWQCRKGSEVPVDCGASHDPYKCSGNAPNGTTQIMCPGDDKNLQQPRSWVSLGKGTTQRDCSSVKCQYYEPPSCCGSFDKQTYSTWPVASDNGFCKTNALCSLVGGNYSFPANSSTATWKCKWPASTYEESCTATKSANNNQPNPPVCIDNPDIRDFENARSCSDTNPASNRKKALSNDCPGSGATKCNYECLTGYHLASETTIINSVSKTVSFCEKDQSSCNNGQHSEGTICVLNTKVVACVPDSLGAGEEWNKESLSNLQGGQCTVNWNNGAWSSPKDKTYSLTPGECNFKCKNGFSWNDDLKKCETNSASAPASASVSLALDAANPNITNGELKAGLPFYIYYYISGSVSSCSLFRDNVKYGTISNTSGGHRELVYTGTTQGDSAQNISYQIKCDNNTVNSGVLQISVVENNDSQTISAKIKSPAQDQEVKVGGRVEFLGEAIPSSQTTEYLWSSSCKSTNNPYATTSSFTYDARSAGVKTFYLSVRKDANSPWSNCEKRQVTVTGYSCIGSFPSQADVSAGKYAYCDADNICGLTCGLTADTPGQQVANKTACSGVKCGYYVPSASDVVGKPSAPSTLNVSCANKTISTNWSEVSGDGITYAFRIDHDQPSGTGQAEPHDVVADGLSNANYVWNSSSITEGTTYTVWVNAVTGNAPYSASSKWGDSKIATVTCSANQDPGGDPGMDENKLIISDVVWDTISTSSSGTVGNPMTICAIVKNDGDTASTAITKKIVYGTKKGGAINSIQSLDFQIPVLQAKGTQQVCFSNKWTPAEAGTYELGANFGGAFPEANTKYRTIVINSSGGSVNDNTDIVTGDDNGGAGDDALVDGWKLIPFGIVTNPTIMKTGEPISFSAVIKNIGKEATPSDTVIGVTLNIKKAGVLIQSESESFAGVSSINSNTEKGLHLNKWFNASEAGDYTLELKIDSPASDTVYTKNIKIDGDFISALNLCGPAGSKYIDGPNYSYSWDASGYRGQFCKYGSPISEPSFPKVGEEKFWECNDSSGLNPQKCYAKVRSNDLDDGTGDDDNDDEDNGNNDNSDNEDDNDDEAESDGVLKCGTANGKFYEADISEFGDDTLCVNGKASPLEPAFPIEGRITEWKCSESGKWVLDTFLLKKVVSCVAARKNIEIVAGCGDASGSYSAKDFRTKNFCETGFKLSSGTPAFPKNIGESVDWVCRPNLLSAVFASKKPVVCSAKKIDDGTDSGDDTDTGNDDSTTGGETALIGNGTGLIGKYFDNKNFTAQKLTLIDPVIDFNWGFGKPNNAIGSDTFSIRWTGYVQPKYTGEWTFQATADDGVRLWVNDQLLIDKWFDQVGTEYSAKINLTAGQKYSIKMEYYENGGDTVVKLAWSHAKQAEEIIPKTQLYGN